MWEAQFELGDAVAQGRADEDVMGVVLALGDAGDADKGRAAVPVDRLLGVEARLHRRDGERRRGVEAGEAAMVAMVRTILPHQTLETVGEEAGRSERIHRAPSPVPSGIAIPQKRETHAGGKVKPRERTGDDRAERIGAGQGSGRDEKDEG